MPGVPSGPYRPYDPAAGAPGSDAEVGQDAVRQQAAPQSAGHVLRILPIGTGLALIGLGLAFLGIRLRQG